MSHFLIEQWKEYPIQVPGKVRYAVSTHGRLKSFTDTIQSGKILRGAPTEGFLFLRYVRISNSKKKYFSHSIHKMAIYNPCAIYPSKRCVPGRGIEKPAQ